MKSQLPLIFFNVATQYENLGDMVINRNLLMLLRQYGEVIVKDEDPPESFLRVMGIRKEERFSRRFWGKFSPTILWNAFLIAKTRGCYFFNIPGHTFISSQVNVFDQVIFTLVIGLFKLAGVRVVRIGVSLGDFSDIELLLAKFRSKCMYCYGLRDTMSFQRAKGYGLSHIVKVADLSFAFPLIPSEPDYSRCPRQISFQDRDYLVLSFRSTPPGTSADFTNRSKECIENLVKFAEMPLILVSQVDRDCPFMLELYEGLVENFKEVTLIDRRLTLEECREVYSNAKLVFSNRLHVLLFTALADGLPVAVIDNAHQSKISALLGDAALEEIIIDIDSIQDLKSRYASIVAREVVIRRKLKAMIEEGERLLNETFETLFR